MLMDLKAIDLANPQMLALKGVVVLLAESTEAHSKIWKEQLESLG